MGISCISWNSWDSRARFGELPTKSWLSCPCCLGLHSYFPPVSLLLPLCLGSFVLCMFYLSPYLSLCLCPWLKSNIFLLKKFALTFLNYLRASLLGTGYFKLSSLSKNVCFLSIDTTGEVLGYRWCDSHLLVSVPQWFPSSTNTLAQTHTYLHTHSLTHMQINKCTQSSPRMRPSWYTHGCVYIHMHLFQYTGIQHAYPLIHIYTHMYMFVHIDTQMALLQPREADVWAAVSLQLEGRD